MANLKKFPKQRENFLEWSFVRRSHEAQDAHGVVDERKKITL